MKRLALALVLPALLGCEDLTGSFGDVIAIQVQGAASRRMEEGTTLTLAAVALNRNGDSLGADIRWAVLDTAAGIAVNPVTGEVQATQPGGPWRVQARVNELRADPIAITVTGAPDSVAAVGDTVLDATGTVSPAVTVRIMDLTTNPGTVSNLAQVPARFVVLSPLGAGLRLRAPGTADSLATADSATVLSAGTGLAAAVVLAGTAPPDSVILEARVTTATGSGVTGSPVRYIIRFP